MTDPDPSSEPADEAGPNLGGRPRVGPQVTLRMPADMLARVDAAARAAGMTRAAKIRDLISAALS